MKGMNLVLIASCLIFLCFLAPVCAMDVNQGNDISIDGAVCMDGAVSSHVKDDAIFNDVQDDDAVPDEDGSIDDDASDDDDIPIDNGERFFDDVAPSNNSVDGNDSMDDNESMDDAIPSNHSDEDSFDDDYSAPGDVPSIVDEENNTTIISSNASFNQNNCSGNCNLCETEDIIDDDEAVQSKDPSDAKDYDDVDDSLTFSPLDDLDNFDMELYLHLNSFLGYDEFFTSRPYRTIANSELKTQDLNCLNLCSFALDIKDGKGFSLDVRTVNDDALLGANLIDSIFNDLPVWENLDNESFVKDLTPEASPDLRYFSSDKTFMKCIKTSIFKVRDI